MSKFDRSGGGGGGTKGPAVLDKRSVEQDCPYCDRTFKQVGISLPSLPWLLVQLPEPGSCLQHCRWAVEPSQE